MTNTITPVILSGGSGTRLWPLSRSSYPKQFARIIGQRSLFQETVLRTAMPGFTKPMIVTRGESRFIVTEHLAAIGQAPLEVLIEPEGRNTAPAVLAAALRLAERDREALMLVCPCDHAIPDGKAFRTAVLSGAEAARDGSLVTFGVQPTRPETGYGWLEADANPRAEAPPSPVPLRRFVEKPDTPTAAQMLEAGRFLWNSGIFLFSVPAILQAFETHQPAMLEAVRAATAAAEPDLAFLRLEAAAWAGVEAVSIDYAIMERADNLQVVPMGTEWSDLGAWDAVAREMEADERGVARSGPAHAIDCSDTLIRAENENQVVVGIGLKNIAVIAMPDAVLVADLHTGQRIREAVELLEAEGAPQASGFPRCHRPWGWYETLSVGQRFQVKRIMVHPGGVLSLQSHFHRAEHWVVVEGSARVTSGDTVTLLSENQSIYIPLGTVHRLENPGRLDLHLIEVQSGSYLGEDDIVRYEDVYARF